MSKPIVNIADLALDHWTRGSFYAADEARIGPAIGLRQLGISYRVVPPGKSSCPFHNHHVEEELFIIVEGEGTYRFGTEAHPIKAGDVVGAPAGGQDTAHQIINTGKLPLRYFATSTLAATEVCEYPDSGKFGVYTRSSGNPHDSASLRHIQQLEHAGVDYWVGEPGAESQDS